MKNSFFKILIITFLIQSCGSKTSPKTYFDKTILNTNILSNFGSKDFEHFIGSIPQKSLYVKTDGGEYKLQEKVTPHIKTFIIPRTEEKLNEIKALTPTDETKEMIKASIKLYEFTLKKYKTDYITIAGLIDADADKEKIENVINDFDNKNLDTYWNLHEQLSKIAIPYAKMNGIKVSRY